MEIDNLQFQALNINDHDFTQVKVRNWLFKKIYKKEVTLMTGSLQVAKLAMIKQARTKTGDYKEANRMGNREYRKLEMWISKCMEVQNRRKLYFAFEGTDRQVGKFKSCNDKNYITQGRKFIMKNGSQSRKYESQVISNIELESLNQQQSVVIEDLEDSVQVTGLKRNRWNHRITKAVEKAKHKEGRIENGQFCCSQEINEAHWSSKEIYDEMSGKQLKSDLVAKARAEEMSEVHKQKVYVKVPLSQCYNETCKNPVGTRWIDINKGDDVHEEYRSRLVAQELKSQSTIEDLFAATPPLEAKKAIFSMCVTEGIGFQKGFKHQGWKIDFIDIRRAYFHAKARRKVFIKLPAEEEAAEGMCGLLLKSMYGTRDAAQNWEFEYANFMETIGFERGKAIPCIFQHPKREIKVAVHGDDFTIAGKEKELDWFKDELQKKFEIKHRGRIGPEPKDEKSMRLLNRVFEWTSEGIIIEADNRHAELIIKDLV